MIRLRTRLLLCGASLAPGAIMLLYVEREEVIRQARNWDVMIWVEPGPLVVPMFWIGVICFLGFVTSLVFDLRRVRASRKEAH